MTDTIPHTLDEAEARRILDDVVDPEIPVLTIGDLGIVRNVAVRGGTAIVTITPTYSGCPAMSLIEMQIRDHLMRAGFTGVEVKTVLSPAWTTDWMTEDGKRKLRDYGIAPPEGKADDAGKGRGALFGLDPEVACPHCGSTETEKISEFGSTACKAQYRCISCREPFDYFKCI